MHSDSFRTYKFHYFYSRIDIQIVHFLFESIVSNILLQPSTVELNSI